MSDKYRIMKNAIEEYYVECFYASSERWFRTSSYYETFEKAYECLKWNVELDKKLEERAKLTSEVVWSEGDVLPETEKNLSWWGKVKNFWRLMHD